MQVVYFTFKDTWEELETYPLKSVMHKYSKHDGTVGKHQEKHWQYFTSILFHKVRLQRKGV